MPNRKIDGRRIKSLRNFTIGEAAERLSVHKRTVQGWIKAGLPCMKERRPHLILGADLQDFLEQRRKSSRRKCASGQLFCFKCHEPRRPAGGMLDYIPITIVSGNLKGICEACDTFMCRRVALTKIGTVTAGCDVAYPQGQQRIVRSA